MKGKTTCPKCKKEFTMDVPDKSDKYMIKCPECTHVFAIQKTCKDESDEECGWEEHGEPRKTILSSLKKKTNKPIIASFLLLAIGVLGIFTAVILGSSESQFTELDLIISPLSSFGVGSSIISFIIAVFSIFALVGSITCFKRRYFLFTVVCTILGIFSIGFFVGLILAIAALILIIMSRDEFENATKGKVF